VFHIFYGQKIKKIDKDNKLAFRRFEEAYEEMEKLKEQVLKKRDEIKINGRKNKLSDIK
jgi:tRNA A-37 threonylcarbamoyl transferase component Bud32